MPCSDVQMSLACDFLYDHVNFGIGRSQSRGDTSDSEETYSWRGGGQYSSSVVIDRPRLIVLVSRSPAASAAGRLLTFQ